PLDEAAMRDRAMQAFGVVFDRVLPVGRERIFATIGTLEGRRLRGEAAHFCGEVARNLFERRRGAVEIDEQEPKKARQADRRETHRLSLEVHGLLRATRRAEPAGQVIGPGVIGTRDECRRQPALALQQLMGAVLTDIEERADLSLAIAEHEDALIEDRARNVASRFRQHRDVADILPRVMENLALLDLEDRRVEVETARQGAGPARIVSEAERRGPLGEER